IKHAKSRNINVIAITDHDNILGCEEAFIAGKKHGIDVIKGMEMSTRYKGKNIHIVCLFKGNIIPQLIVDYSNEQVEKSRTRAVKILKNVENDFKLKVDIPAILDSKGIVNKLNLYKNVLDNNTGLSEADAITILKTSKKNIGSIKISFEDGVELIKKSGCIGIIAHPCLIERELLLEIVDSGLHGIETKYPENKDDDYEFLTNLAINNNLLISAGSDFHGDDDHFDIGTVYLDNEDYSNMKEKLL
ncbi:MAG: PHP domain-containing protein, partial [Anaeroplasmataceae bacterium]